MAKDKPVGVPSGDESLQEIREAPTFWVRRSHSIGKKEVSEEEERGLLEVQKFVVPPIYLKGSLGFTISLGNYNMVRLDCGISVPCYRGEEDEKWDQTLAWMESKVNPERVKIEEWVAEQLAKKNGK